MSFILKCGRCGENFKLKDAELPLENIIKFNLAYFGMHEVDGVDVEIICGNCDNVITLTDII